jgi:flagellar hook-associated protein 1 FlgK
VLQFSIGVSALQAAQQGLAIAGNNLANASTPGYHRQVPQVTSQDPMTLGGLSFGRGIAITDIHRAVDQQLDASLTQQLTQNGMVDARLTASTQLEQTLSTGAGTPQGQLESLLNNLQQLSANPTDSAARQVAVSSASSVATAFNSVADSLTQMQLGLDQSIRGVISQINPLTSQIAALNGKISQLTSQGVSPNDLLDQRGQLVDNLAQKIGLQVQNGNNGQITLLVAGLPLVIGDQAQTLEPRTNKAGEVTLGISGSDPSVSLTSGQLGGLLTQRNTQLADYRNRINTLARQVMSSFDAVQSTGLGGSGGFTQLTGQRGVSSVSANLNAAGLAFPPGAGSLYIGVTNTATGERTMTEVKIDPKSQSIQDVSNSLASSVPHVQSFVNTQTGTLSVIAASGYTFDFTGGIDSAPTTSSLAGTTSTPTLGGKYTGPANDSYTFKFNSSGTIGVTPDLQADVTDQTGAVIGKINVGLGYQTGQPITLANGVTLKLSSGGVTSGDSFTSRVVSTPDTGGLLTSLGMNTLFSGNDASSMKVNSDVLADPGRLATSQSGQAGDATNLQRFVALGSTAVLSGGKQTFAQYSNQMVSDIGADVQSLTGQQSTNQLLTSRIQAQQQSVSGVDTNEELADVLKYQQMFQLAGKYISAVNDALQQLVQITM